jgi:hypothetical protein
MNTALDYSTRVVSEGGRRCKKSTLNDLVHLTPLRIPLMNPPIVFSLKLFRSAGEKTLQRHTIFLAILHQGVKRAIFMRVNIGTVAFIITKKCLYVYSCILYNVHIHLSIRLRNMYYASMHRKRQRSDLLSSRLKGTVSRDFCLWFFS